MGKIAHILQGNTLFLVFEKDCLYLQCNILIIEESIGFKIILKAAEVYIRRSYGSHCIISYKEF